MIKTKTFLKRFVMPNVIWIVVFMCCLLSMLGVEGMPDLLHSFLIGLILELVVLAIWVAYCLIRHYQKKNKNITI